MRIACIHIPQFALQCATRLDPSLRGAPVAVVSGVEPGRERAGVLHAPIVLACSRAAWALGARLGMTATAARSLSPSLEIVTSDAVLERDCVRAVGDSLLALTPVVDLGGRVGAGGAHLAMYVEVPAKTRGHSFGERIVALLDELGLSARIGIADDRFTAWVAAAHAGHTAGAGAEPESSVVAVPRGGSAAFLAPRPLSLLAITPEVQHMLEALGVRTLGEFAALPAPSVARPFEADYQALARGESGTTLRPYTPDAAIREDIVISAGNVLELDGAVGGPAAIAIVARRIALRLAGRGRSAARIEALAYRADEVVELPAPMQHDQTAESPEELTRALMPVLDSAVGAANANASSGRWRLRTTVTNEALIAADGTVTQVLAEGSSPFARVPANSNAELSRPRLSLSLAASGSPASTASAARYGRSPSSATSPASTSPPSSAMSSASSASSTRGAGTARVPARIATGSATSPLTYTGSARLSYEPIGRSGSIFTSAATASSSDTTASSSDTTASASDIAAGTCEPSVRATAADVAELGPLYAAAARRDARGATTASASGASPRGEGASREDLYAARAAELLATDRANTLSVVLASTGSLFALSPDASVARFERREAHRRTRRGKQRRTRPTAATQPRLFERISSK